MADGKDLTFFSNKVPIIWSIHTKLWTCHGLKGTIVIIYSCKKNVKVGFVGERIKWVCGLEINWVSVNVLRLSWVFCNNSAQQRFNIKILAVSPHNQLQNYEILMYVFLHDQLISWIFRSVPDAS